jgi:hypothetical protein
MKKILWLVAVMATAFAARAQSDGPARGRTALTLGGEVDFTQRSIYNIGTALGGTLEFPLVTNFSLSLSGAYSWMHVKTIVIDNLRSVSRTDAYVPVKAGVKYYAGPNVYLQAEAGSALQQKGGSDNLFAYSLGTGFIIPFSNRHQGLDVGFRFESWAENRMQTLALHAAYRLGF